MIYGELKNNLLCFSPNPIQLNGYVICNPTENQLLEAGYLPIIFTDPPLVEPGHVPESHWEEQNKKIVQVWTIVLAPSDLNPSYNDLKSQNSEMKEALNILGVKTE